MFGALLKSYYAQKHGIDRANLFVVSIIPCTAKKYEVQRPEMVTDGLKDVDLALTTRELAQLIRRSGIVRNRLPNEDFDRDIVGENTGAGVIFGVTGGVMEAALRTAYFALTGKEHEAIKFEQVRGFNDIKDAEIDINGTKVRVAVASGMREAKKLLDQIKEGKSPILHQNYGVDWFDTNLFNYYSNRVRDYFSQYSPFDLMSNRAILNDIDAKVLKQMQDFVAKLSKEKEFPIIIRQVTIGKATPNEKQLEEMNNTAKAVQAKQTQEREAEVQLAREKAERQRAKADKAYMEEMHLSTSDFISLKWIETIAAKNGANIDVLVGGNTTSMWNVRR
jgi:hypothetical protein